MTRAEAGRLGGLATARTHGRAFYVAIGRAGKETTIARHGVAYWEGLVARKGWHGPRRPDLARDLAAGEWLAAA